MTSSALGAASLWAAFALGLTGGFGHCLAMCGPFVAGASIASAARDGRSHSRRGGLAFQATYHLGRLTTYALIGAVLGLLGQAGALSTLAGPFSPTALTRYLKFGAGIVTVFVGLAMLYSWMRRRGVKLPEPAALLTSSRWFVAATRRATSTRWGLGLPLGMLMGLLPCAPLLPVELAALATGWPLLGALVMLAFGLGTVPALAGFGAATGLVARRAHGWLGAAAAVAVIALGALTVLQGAAVLGL